MHTTNYFNCFIEVAEDCPLSEGKIPKPGKTKPTIAEMQYDMLANHPYQHTSDELLLEIYMRKNDLPPDDKDRVYQTFFSKGQPCLRCSPLTKTHGYGLHFNESGKIALVPRESLEYEKWANDDQIIKVKAMKSKK